MTYLYNLHLPKIKEENFKSDVKSESFFLKKKSLTRRFKRRLKCFMKPRQFLKNKQEIMEFHKFSMICMVGTPIVCATTNLFQLFIELVFQAWKRFL